MRWMVLALVWSVGCSTVHGQKNGPSDGSEGQMQFSAPQVAPIVRAATPVALRAQTAEWLAPARHFLTALWPIGVAHADGAPTVDDTIRGLFMDMFPTASGIQAQGKINAALIDLDDRVKGSAMMAGPSGDGGSSCLDDVATSHRIDLSAVSPALDLTVQAQCNVMFQAGPMSQGGAGLVFGTQNDAYSMWLNVNGAGMGFVANVMKASSPDKSVDFLSLAHEPMRVSAYRVKAQPSTQSFELACAGGCSSPKAGIGGLDCGFQMISDGHFVWVTGSFAPMGNCATATPVANCYSAVDLSAQTSGCEALKSAFTMAPLSSADLAPAGDAIDAALALSTAFTGTK